MGILRYWRHDLSWYDSHGRRPTGSGGTIRRTTAAMSAIWTTTAVSSAATTSTQSPAMITAADAAAARWGPSHNDYGRLRGRMEWYMRGSPRVRS